VRWGWISIEQGGRGLSMEKPPRLAYIYALMDPRTGEMRYIGSTTDPRRRLQGHLADARAHHRLRSLGRTHWDEGSCRLVNG
jgi:hypothetical protein